MGTAHASSIVARGRPTSPLPSPLQVNVPPACSAAWAAGEPDVGTAIMEHGATPQGITYVIDSGLTVEPRWDPAIGVQTLAVTPHSKAGVKRRWAMAGRTEPGWVFPLLSVDELLTLPEEGIPSVLGQPLERFILAASEFDVVDAAAHPWPSHHDARPEVVCALVAELQRASMLLIRLGALGADRRSLPVGENYST